MPAPAKKPGKTLPKQADITETRFLDDYRYLLEQYDAILVQPLNFPALHKPMEDKELQANVWHRLRTEPREYWVERMKDIAATEFACGASDPRSDRPPFKAHFRWLMTSKNSHRRVVERLGCFAKCRRSLDGAVEVPVTLPGTRSYVAERAEALGLTEEEFLRQVEAGER